MDPIAIVLIIFYIIYIAKSLVGFFLTGLVTSMIGLSRYHMKKHKARSRLADIALLTFGIAFLVSAAKIVMPILCIIGIARGIHGYYLVSMISFVIFASIRGIGISFGPVCKGCGKFRVDPIELLIIFFSAMAYFV